MLPIILIAAGAGLLLSSCKSHDDDNPETEEKDCGNCHMAPDADLPFTPIYNAQDDEFLECRHPLSAVGAHDRHLNTGSVIARLSCAECHHVPDSVWGDERHIDNNIEGYDECRAEIDTTDATFPLGATIDYSVLTMTCGGCHDLSEYGGAARSPAWNAKRDSSETACPACHDAEIKYTANGIPFHPEKTECGDCHSTTVATQENGLNEIIDKSQAGAHMNGALDLDPLTEDCPLNCNSCHDLQTEPAKDDPAYNTKFFHWRHTGKDRPDQIAADYSCDTCHDDLVPSARNYRTMTTHMDGEIDVKFSGLAVKKGANPVWNETESKCESTYCHDQGGRNPSPTAEPNEDARACDSCHGAPPDNATPPVHVDDTACSRCHEETAAEMPDGTQGIAGISKHVNGSIEIGALECYDCHDSIQSDEGAAQHAAHEAVGVSCPACHGDHGEGGADESGHPDGVRQILFRGMAAFIDREASFNEANGTCANYCHHGSEGGTLSNASWREANEYDPADCTGCHGDPPAINDHPQIQFCSICHTETVATDEAGVTTIRTPGLHINHERDKREGLDNCTSCHDDLRLAENPDSLQVHGTHETGGAVTSPISCGTCHDPVNRVDDAGHIGDFDSTAEITFSGLAVGASFEREGRSCSFEAGGCHLVAGSPGMRPTPSWLITPRNPDICNECHSVEPEERHQSAEQCDGCHDETAGPARTIANRANHINMGTDDVSCEGCHTPDETHESHTTDPIFTAGYNCSECHGEDIAASPENIWTPAHMNGSVAIEWGAIAAANESAPVWDGAVRTCYSVYCHDIGGSNPAPVWGETSIRCGSCHGVPPLDIPPHERGDTRCQSCHDISGMIGINVHANGVSNLRPAEELCATCHGLPPPPDTLGGADVASPGVGQHSLHAARYSCDTCHGEGSVPATMMEHSPRDGDASIAFTGLAIANGAGAVYDHASQTCSVYCHGATIAGAQIPAPRWTDASGEISSNCDSCHGEPPPDETHEIWDIMRDIGFPMECSDCHGAVVDADRNIINSALHMNGSVDTME